ncbi:uncharacterized protein MEPE_01427 [Melanopsichium pennsylvanicum]|uniref:Uncharacterized protein n=1 Tax=Melanopsichium pennsylvanicum TaxID=63383 RepID=A0AAJ4XJ99_9BASI|nr:uncharacterized protein MEPE_01427 [Melanopsichium pennsylvanicum]
MFLYILTYVFVASVGIAILVCLALGLLSLSQYIESHSTRARRLGLRLFYLTIFFQLAITVFDDVPFLPLFPASLSAPMHYLALSQSDWPFSTSRSSVGLYTTIFSLVLLPLVSHIWLVRYHTLTIHAWQRHRYDTLHRPKLPGGRLDWDVDSTQPLPGVEMTNLQVCAVLVVCVWSVPVYRLLGRIAGAQWGSGGVVVGQSRKQSERRS